MILTSAKPHHISALAENLRACDREELRLSIGDAEPYGHILGLWLDGDRCEAILTDTGVVAGVWGTAPGPAERVGLIWMLGTQAINQVALPFLRACPGRIDQAHDTYDILACTPWRENSLHLAWLNWCGFAALDPGHGPFIGYTHVRSSRYSAGHAGCNGCECRGAEPAAEPID
ncbi:hypothetical protein [Burkholderia oklahomensis]|uniref:Uncharacterized protein n=1 Tax=Burkholderia oklahomensis TaxID=342113 RepID=A0AAI8BEN1_9BURK|nr:hypothetical protein [Burkholderia oklahomensis]AIO70813.1 hypothetical protein DM82_4361 [Burkholderia oklahomensis]AOI40096.1 hypothetical protein WG70_11065 [Burkholderia oklahomensis EO147]KUY68346.1 hypothetical protein WG70_25095 [Burkholderia oklahomensis EO147]QPS39534.1 hypothetical protein I6G57_27230 [Burkholderia oklahomensis]